MSSHLMDRDLISVSLDSRVLFFGWGNMLINKLVYERWQGSKSQLELNFFLFLKIVLKERHDGLTEYWCKFLLTLTTESANKITRHVILESFFENKRLARTSPLVTARLTVIALMLKLTSYIKTKCMFQHFTYILT